MYYSLHAVIAINKELYNIKYIFWFFIFLSVKITFLKTFWSKTPFYYAFWFSSQKLIFFCMEANLLVLTFLPSPSKIHYIRNKWIFYFCLFLNLKFSRKQGWVRLWIAKLLPTDRRTKLLWFRYSLFRGIFNKILRHLSWIGRKYISRFSKNYLDGHTDNRIIK